MADTRARIALLLVLAMALLATPAQAQKGQDIGGVRQIDATATGAKGPGTVTRVDRTAPATVVPTRPTVSPPAVTPSPTPSPSRAAPASPSSVPRTGPGGSERRTGTNSVALTFDDGPDPVNTPRMLDLLRRNRVKATFCVVGFRARDHPDLIRRIWAEGHTLCNHSWQHRFDLAKQSDAVIAKDLADTNAAIRAAAPGAQIKYFRAPGGNFTSRLNALARQAGMLSIYWQVDPRDWEHRGAPDPVHVARIISEVQRDTLAGSIVLSHDNKQPTTITAYETLLPWLKERFTLIPLPA
jgi:peptidoglycan/xylan/chitin deacetylase (PgdA/CDA1 family)